MGLFDNSFSLALEAFNDLWLLQDSSSSVQPAVEEYSNIFGNGLQEHTTSIDYQEGNRFSTPFESSNNALTIFEEEGSVDKKEEHNTKERIRRMKLNASYLLLGSLIPNSRAKRWTAPVIIDRALQYIPQLENILSDLFGNIEDEVICIVNASTILVCDERVCYHIHVQNYTCISQTMIVFLSWCAGNWNSC
ncbi:hypothetical protein UlMin_008792 [Ulmus minor]